MDVIKQSWIIWLGLILNGNVNKPIAFMNNISNKNQVVQFLCQPQGGRTYLLNALNSNSEQVFMEALHNIIDAMSQDLSSSLAKKL